MPPCRVRWNVSKCKLDLLVEVSGNELVWVGDDKFSEGNMCCDCCWGSKAYLVVHIDREKASTDVLEWYERFLDVDTAEWRRWRAIVERAF